MPVKVCTRCGTAKSLDEFPLVRRGLPGRHGWCQACFAIAKAAHYRRNLEAQKIRLLRNTAQRRLETQSRIIHYLSTHPCVDCGERDIVVLEFDHVRGTKLGNVSAYANGGRSWPRVEAEIHKCEVRCANCHRRKTTERRGPRPPSGAAVISPLPSKPLQLILVSGLRLCRICKSNRPLTEFPFRSMRIQTRQWICLECQRTYSRAWYANNRARQAATARRNDDKRVRRATAFVQAFLSTHPCNDCGQPNSIVLEFDHLRAKKEEISAMVRRGAPISSIALEMEKCEVRCANCHRRKTARDRGWYRARAQM